MITEMDARRIAIAMYRLARHKTRMEAFTDSMHIMLEVLHMVDCEDVDKDDLLRVMSRDLTMLYRQEFPT